MEGVAFSLLDCLGMCRRDGLDMTAAVMTGGVTRSQIWSHIIADVLGMNMRTIRHGDSALGVCMLSATAVGIFASIDHAVSACVLTDQMVETNPANRDRYDRLFSRYQETGRFLDTMARKFSAASV
jgi:xylulokinase